MVLIRPSPVTAGTRCYTPPSGNEALRRATDAKAADRNYLFGLDNYVYLGGGQVQLTR